jgi:prevent-host-death family protein
MKIASVAEVKANLSAFVKASEEGPVVVTRNGKAVAVLLGVENDAEVEDLILARSRRLRTVLDAAREQIRSGAGLSHEDFWKSVKQPAAKGTRSRKKPLK